MVCELHLKKSYLKKRSSLVKALERKAERENTLNRGRPPSPTFSVYGWGNWGLPSACDVIDMNFSTWPAVTVTERPSRPQTALVVALTVPESWARMVGHTVCSSDWGDPSFLWLSESEAAVFWKVPLPCQIRRTKLQLAFCFKSFSIQPFGMKRLSF